MSESVEVTGEKEPESQENGENTFYCIRFMLTRTNLAYLGRVGWIVGILHCEIMLFRDQ